MRSSDVPHALSERPGARAGLALLNALLIMAVLTIALVTAISYTTSSTNLARHVKYDTEAYNVARAGLQDALDYFRRQSVQPVTTFSPQYIATDAVHTDTTDPYLIAPGCPNGSGSTILGIVKEIPLDPSTNLYGRYEIGKITRLDRDPKGTLNQYSCLQPDASGVLQPVAIPNAASGTYEGVSDVSNTYGLQTPGLIWQVVCRGYVYRRAPGFTPSNSGYWFFQGNNQVLDQIALQTEFYRLGLNDYGCALMAKQATATSFSGGSQLTFDAGGTYGVECASGVPVCVPLPTVNNGAFTPLTQLVATSNDVLDWYEVFGVPNAQSVAQVATYDVTSVSSLPNSLPAMSLTYLNPAGGTATFDQNHPLNGGGVLVCDGNLVIAQGSGSSFAGYVYVTGNLTINQPAVITGQVVCKGAVSLTTNGSGTDTITLEYNSGLIASIRNNLGQYQERGAALKVVGL